MPQRTLTESEYNAIKAHVLDAAPEGLKEEDFGRYVGPALASAVGEAESSAAPLEGSSLARFASGAWKTINPSGIVTAVVHPIDTAKALIDAHSAQLDKAKQAYADGRYSEAVGHLGAAALPVLGPAAANAGERIGTGDVAGGLGEGAGLVGSVAAPRLVKGATKGVNTLATRVVESPGAQNAIGATSGAVAGGAAGHPYIGMAIGSKYGGPMVKSLAEGVQSVTGGAPPPTVAAILSDVDVARQAFAAGKITKPMLDAVERQAARIATTAAGRPQGVPTIPSKGAAMVDRLTDTQPAAAAAPAPAVAVPPSNALPPTGTTAERAAALRTENPNIDAQGAAMRARADAAKAPANIDEAIAAAKAAHPPTAMPEPPIVQPGAASPAVAAPVLPKLTAPEVQSYLKMKLAGKSDAQIAEAIQAMREFNAKYGLTVPTAEDTRFPKGNRGGPPPEP
jgi:hypothetical protein